MKGLLLLLATAATAHAGVDVVELRAQPVIERTVDAKPAELGAALATAIAALLVVADKNGLDLAGPPFARYLTRGDIYTVEVGLPLVHAGPGKLRGSIRATTLPAGPAATLLLDGPHERLPEAHRELDRWLAEHHRTAAGPRWEIYLTAPLAPQQQTRIVVPLER